MAEANRSTLESFLGFLHQGSPYASVSRVDVTWLLAEGSFKNFDVRYHYRE